tara:strand:- start:152 stop:325 length:174 start_codon:yes stop_codon:yes gene_type:complete
LGLRNLALADFHESHFVDINRCTKRWLKKTLENFEGKLFSVGRQCVPEHVYSLVGLY